MKQLLTPPLIALVCAALLGLVLAAHVLRGRFAHWALSPIHALLGVVGLSLMLTPLTAPAALSRAWIGFGFLLAAAGLGLVLATLHLRKKMPPRALVLVHAGCAVSGLTILFHTALTS